MILQNLLGVKYSVSAWWVRDLGKRVSIYLRISYDPNKTGQTRYSVENYIKKHCFSLFDPGKRNEDFSLTFKNKSGTYQRQQSNKRNHES